MRFYLNKWWVRPLILMVEYRLKNDTPYALNVCFHLLNNKVLRKVLCI